jgi:xanthine/CO dehydrogenase XdhC/CoxF family maturation factor
LAYLVIGIFANHASFFLKPQIILEPENFLLATLITRKGSAHHSAGANMLVRADGMTAGTVGGGSLEARVTTLAGAFHPSFQYPGRR